MDPRVCTAVIPQVKTPTNPTNVSVKSKCGRIACVRVSSQIRRAVVVKMTLQTTTRKVTPATPVNSAIWISGHVACNAMPRPFQPNPEINHPRVHSNATQVAARHSARKRLYPELSHGEPADGGSGLARASISLHLSRTTIL